MKAIISIGYTTLMVADVKIATKVIELLSGAAEVEDRIHSGKIVLKEREFEISMKIVPQHVVTVRRRSDGTDEAVAEIPSRKRLNGQSRLALPGA